jgi:hypothetical protein
MFTTLIVGLIYAGLADQGFGFDDVFNRMSSNESFSRTDYFSIVAHFAFLQV